jgi:N6-adenosine-specific RNA methylase IME4
MLTTISLFGENLTTTVVTKTSRLRNTKSLLTDQARLLTDERIIGRVDESLTDFPGLSGTYSTILVDPPWRFLNRTGKVAPEHKRLHRYPTMSFDEIGNLPVNRYATDKAHLYMWTPNALLPEALNVMKAWGFKYKTNIVWYKVRKDGGPDGRGVGFYFRNVTEMLLFGIKGSMRTLAPGRRQVNILISRKEEHSKKPNGAYDLIKQCSPGPYLELFARERVIGWTQWGDEVDSYDPAKRAHRAYGWNIRESEIKQPRAIRIIAGALQQTTSATKSHD